MRIFSAFDVSDEFKSKIWESVKDLCIDFDNINWVKPENFHITLKFYENIGDIKRVTDETSDFAKNLTSFVVKWNGFSFFSHKVFFVSLKVTPFKIVRLIRKDINTNFSPHITLARNKYGLEIKEKLSQKIADIEFNHSETVKTLSIYESIIKNTGPEYRVIEKIRL